jgi:hypothetical protein
MTRAIVAAALAAALVGGAAVAADLKSGPPAGAKVPGPFKPFNVNGEDAGSKACLYCKAGDSPTVAVFARSADDPALHKLVAALEAATAKHAKAELNGFVVFCSAEDKLKEKLAAWAEKAKLKNVILSIEAVEGPDKYEISKDADVTVLLYKDRVVAANHSFAKGKLTDAHAEKIAAEIANLVK